MYLASSEDIKKLDKLASEKYGIPEIQLMENAGKAIFDEINKNISAKSFAVFCGKGNNGGDGFVVARLLKNNGCEVKVYLTHEETELSETARIAYEKMKKENIQILKVTDSVEEDDVVIDALLGISVSGAPRGNIKLAIDKISSMSNMVVSVDIPSGLCADSGNVLGSVVTADYTYTLALDKKGLNINQGILVCGIKKVLDIGIPQKALSDLDFV